MAMDRIPHQPPGALAGWFAALKAEQAGGWFLVLQVEGAPDDNFVQIVYDGDEFLIDHPFFTKRQKSRRRRVLRTLMAEGAAPRESESRSVLGRLGREAQAAAEKAIRIMSSIFRTPTIPALQVEIGAFTSLSDHPADGSDEGTDNCRDSDLPSPERFAVDCGQRAARTMREAGYQADFSMASLKEVDRLIDEQSDRGSPVPDGYFDPSHLPASDRVTTRLFGLGCYVGEVLKQKYVSDWHADSRDFRQAVHGLRLRFASGAVVDPIGKVFKRFENGPEDSLEAFGFLVALSASEEDEKAKNPRTRNWTVTALRYPKAAVVDHVQHAGAHNILLTTADDIAKVWRWYSRRLELGKSPLAVVSRDCETGPPIRLAVRRTPRNFNRTAPFRDNEHPQVVTLQGERRAVTVVLSRSADGCQTTITLFLFE
jgi:hypothetical protein